jgi:hypothetical protein
MPQPRLAQPEDVDEHCEDHGPQENGFGLAFFRKEEVSGGNYESNKMKGLALDLTLIVTSAVSRRQTLRARSGMGHFTLPGAACQRQAGFLDADAKKCLTWYAI